MNRYARMTALLDAKDNALMVAQVVAKAAVPDHAVVIAEMAAAVVVMAQQGYSNG